jgi:type IV secretory pathway VirB10-like protein
MIKPRGVSKWFGLTIVGGVAVGLGFIGYAMLHKVTPRPSSAPAIHNNGSAPDWFAKYRPSAQATPAPMRVAAAPFHPASSPPPQMVQSPYQAQPKASPAVSEFERMRQREYMAALSSEIGVKQDNGQTLETPRISVSNAESSPIDVSPQPAPPHTLSAWSWIYATLETGIDSDHPGDVLGRISQDVKDSVTQTEVLIPMGSKLHGIQGGREALNQNDQTLIVRWDDIEFPNGGHVQLGDMPGADPSGYPGFEDLVDNHYARTWTPAVLISAITAGSMLASNPTYGSAGGYNVTQEALGAGASRMGSFGQEQLMSQLINNKPTIVIRPGYQFRVLITRDLVFSQPYVSAQ